MACLRLSLACFVALHVGVALVAAARHEDAAELLDLDGDEDQSGRLAQLEKQVGELKKSRMKLNHTNAVLRSRVRSWKELKKEGDDCDGSETCCEESGGTTCMAASINECDGCCSCMGYSELEKDQSGGLAQLEKQVGELKKSMMKLNHTNGILRSRVQSWKELKKEGDDCDGSETCCEESGGTTCMAASINECDGCCSCMGYSE